MSSSALKIAMSLEQRWRLMADSSTSSHHSVSGGVAFPAFQLGIHPALMRWYPAMGHFSSPRPLALYQPYHALKELDSATTVLAANFEQRVPPASSEQTRKGITNFSIEGILGKQKLSKKEEDEEEDNVESDEAQIPATKPSIFSLNNSEHISKTEVKHEPGVGQQAEDPMARFSWLQCTRYKPPRLPRAKRKEVKKRKVGRNPRVPFSPQQVATLEQKFRLTHYLSSVDVAELSTTLNLSDNRVKIWFQNRRARERRDKETAEKVKDVQEATPLTTDNIQATIAPATSTAITITSQGTLTRISHAADGSSAFEPVALVHK
ncbi:homeobox protein MSX-2-like [Anneissia japonica]|uniref:homeobox protein MSX-2-like n=1 Tax=Anneissia japonica TaxID=1529436 RepID=UPI001425A2B9|nr:homeobox protein MSX-2-like [Anneissia japonica]